MHMFVCVCVMSYVIRLELGWVCAYVRIDNNCVSVYVPVYR